MVVVGRISSESDFRQFITELAIKGSMFIVKPSWASTTGFTDARTLDWLFSGLKGKVKIVEAYSPERCKLEATQETQETSAIARPKAKWQWFKKQEARFLESTGIREILKKHSVEYINVTEETWAMKTLEPDEVREIVDTKFGILVNNKFYSFVPTRMYELRGSTFISLNSSQRIQDHVSLSTGSLFSLIPDPDRQRKWRGKDERRYSQSIVDINKIYRSLFSPCYWINIIEESGAVVGGRNSVEADAVSANILGVNPEAIQYLRQAASVFGGYDKKVLAETSN